MDNQRLKDNKFRGQLVSNTTYNNIPYGYRIQFRVFILQIVYIYKHAELVALVYQTISETTQI